MKIFTSFALVVFVVLFPVEQALACSVIESVTAKEGVHVAELILHVRALEYVSPPKDDWITTGPAPSTIRFQIVEVVKGKHEQKEIVLNGYLIDYNDWNDESVPYNFVRPDGRSGSCFANTYKKGGNFLLLLVKTKADKWTTSYWALGPVNEQIRKNARRAPLRWVPLRWILREKNDPWLAWVKKEVGKK